MTQAHLFSGRLRGRCHGTNQPSGKNTDIHWYHLTVCTVVPHDLEYRHVNARTGGEYDGGTDCKSLVNYLVTLKMTGLICIPVYLYRAQNGLPTFIRRAGILKYIGISQYRLEYRNIDLSLLTGNYLATSYTILMRFGLVTPEFKTWEVVRPASIILPRLVQLRSLWGGADRHCSDQ